MCVCARVRQTVWRQYERIATTHTARGKRRHGSDWPGDSEAAAAAAEVAAAATSGFTAETLARLRTAPGKTNTPGSDVALMEGIRYRLKETTRHLYVRLLRLLQTARLLFRRLCVCSGKPFASP